jgi:hypothetical protein
MGRRAWRSRSDRQRVALMMGRLARLSPSGAGRLPSARLTGSPGARARGEAQTAGDRFRRQSADSTYDGWPRPVAKPSRLKRPAELSCQRDLPKGPRQPGSKRFVLCSRRQRLRLHKTRSSGLKKRQETALVSFLNAQNLGHELEYLLAEVGSLNAQKIPNEATPLFRRGPRGLARRSALFVIRSRNSRSVNQSLFSRRSQRHCRPPNLCLPNGRNRTS